MIKLHDDWKSISLEPQAELLQRSMFTYRIEGNEYTIELFERQSGECYAIGMPSDRDQIIVYGSAMVTEPKIALQQTINKINRDHFQTEITQIGEDVRPIQE